jgi:hypothetical protein
MRVEIMEGGITMLKLDANYKGDIEGESEECEKGDK